MGTKAKPSTYDCYANLDPDEPYFLLMGRDLLASHLVRMWAKSRQAMIDAGTKPSTDQAQVNEALRCADEIDMWRVLRGKAVVPQG
jgi:hypothetical protein